MILGIDTSNYTTSVALCDNGEIIADERQLLYVKEGMRGLRQSEAFYQHVNNLPELLERLHDLKNVQAICVSDAPRRVEGSYMPCFLSGVDIARILSHGLNVPMYKVSHQQGHIKAALYESNIDDTVPFLCVHLSGGTTEVLLCRKSEGNYISEIVGETSDISAGQFIDRIGVACGLRFPCGKEMDGMCRETSRIKLPVFIKDRKVSFSGVETKLANLIKTEEHECDEIITAAFKCVSQSLIKLVKECLDYTQTESVLFAGGVSGSVNIAGDINEKLGKNYYIEFAKQGLGNDNAVGVALIGEELHRRAKVGY